MKNNNHRNAEVLKRKQKNIYFVQRNNLPKKDAKSDGKTNHAVRLLSQARYFLQQLTMCRSSHERHTN